MNPRYLGDGVYALWDGFGVWLHVGSHDAPTDKVYLEPAVIADLMRFYRDCVAPEIGAKVTE